MSAKSVIICCLPVSGPQNPYQLLMMHGLNADSRLSAIHGADGKFLAVIRTWIKFRPTYIHFDWNYRYFIRRIPMLSYVNAVVFILELLIVKYIAKCQLVWTIHNIEAHDGSQRILERNIQRVFAHLCTWIRLLSTENFQETSRYLTAPHTKFRVVPVGNYIDYYANDLTPDEARTKLSIDPSEIVFLYFGGIRPYKGIDNLIESFREISEKTWRLIIVGAPLDRKYTAYVMQLARGDPRVVIMNEFVVESDVQLYMKASNVVVLPFRAVENSGSAILAMGFAKAIIAPRIGVLPDILSQQDELLYEQPQLLDGLLKISAYSSQHLAELGYKNYERASTFSWQLFCNCF